MIRVLPIPIPGYPGYMVDSDGTIYGKLGRALRGRPRRGGYLQVALYDGAGRATQKYVHNLVLEAFVGPRPEGQQACHNNSDPMDNRLLNLRWDTPSGNQADRSDVGGACRRGHDRLERSSSGHCLACRRELYVLRTSTLSH